MEITNEMIYQRLEQIDKRFEQVDKRFEQMDRNLMRIESLQTSDRQILMNLWEHKDNMKLSYTRTLLTVTGLFSGVVAFIVSVITGKAMIFKG